MDERQRAGDPVWVQVVRGGGVLLLILAPGPLLVLGDFGTRQSGFLALAGATAVALSYTIGR